MVAVGPGIPARVIPLLQDKLLPAKGSALERQPPVGGNRPGSTTASAEGGGGAPQQLTIDLEPSLRSYRGPLVQVLQELLEHTGS